MSDERTSAMGRRAMLVGAGLALAGLGTGPSAQASSGNHASASNPDEATVESTARVEPALAQWGPPLVSGESVDGDVDGFSNPIDSDVYSFEPNIADRVHFQLTRFGGEGLLAVSVVNPHSTVEGMVEVGPNETNTLTVDINLWGSHAVLVLAHTVTSQPPFWQVGAGAYRLLYVNDGRP